MTNKSLDDFLDELLMETMHPDGFMSKLRENSVREDGFRRLMEAVDAIAHQVADRKCLDRLFVACLFEAPWEIENTRSHYSSVDPALGMRVSRMADELRSALNRMLWTGLEQFDRRSEGAPRPRWSCSGSSGLQ